MMPGTSRRVEKALQAILLLCLAVTLFAVMDGIAKLLSGGYSVVQIVWARYAFAVPVTLAAAPPASWMAAVRCERPILQATRGLLPLLASVTIIIGLSLMPLADATAISFTSPLIVVTMSAPLLGEKLPLAGWVGVGLGFVGALIIIRPGADAIAWAALFPLATAFSFALYQVLTRVVSRNEAPVVTLIWTVAVGLVVTTPLLPEHWNRVSWTDWPLLALSGLLFGGGQWFLIRAFATAPAPILAPFTYVQIVAAMAFGALVFGDFPDTLTMSGIILVVLAGAFVVRSARAVRPVTVRRTE